MNHFSRQALMCLIVLAGVFLLTGCNRQRTAPTSTAADLIAPADSTPTPTRVLLPGVPDEPPVATTPPPPTGGEVELHFTDAMTQKEWTAHFPFDIVEQATLRRLSGSAILDCQCEIEQCGEGVCMMYHSEHYMDASVTGIIHVQPPIFPMDS